MKRLLDILVSAAGLLVLWPLLLLAALLIKLDSRGPVLFRQERVGRFFRIFTLYRFRTLDEEAADTGEDLLDADDRRITRVGRFLRHTRLDQLPALFNVLKGEMSLVGPPPELARYVAQYREDFREILQVRPGMTDVASLVYGDEDRLLKRSETPEETYVHVILPEKLRLSKQYTREASLWSDLKLAAATLVYWLYPMRTLDAAFGTLARRHTVVATIVQGGLVIGANALAYLLRFDGHIPEKEFRVFLRALPALFVIRMAWAWAHGLFRDIWRFAGFEDMRHVVGAVALGSLTFWAAILLVPSFSSYSRAVLVLDTVLCVALLGGVRLARRAHEAVRSDRLVRTKVLVVGSGRAVERVIRELVGSRASQTRVIGVVDGDDLSTGLDIHGVPILGSESDLEAIVRETDPDELVVACNGLAERRDALVDRCRRLGKPFRLVPDLGEILTGHAMPGMVRTIEAEDVLFREPFRSDLSALHAWCAGKRILITGAGGSIGSEIARQVARLGPAQAILFEKHENSLYEVDRQLRKNGFGRVVVPVIGDVTDAPRVAEIMARCRPEVVFHAAAYKHVPMMEHHPREAFKTNVLGTRTVAQAAACSGAQAFVLISTDKAVEPMSIMGTTKRIAELELQTMQRGCGTRFVTVRFGNVLDSSGSVIPLFREQIESGGPVTVTHPEMTRLFMTIPEAVQLILHAGTLGQGGEVFVLDMGRPVRILDMAQSLIRLYGLRPGKDIEIVFTGLRPGEKLYERLFNDHEEILRTNHPRILMAVPRAARPEARQEEMQALLCRVEQAAGSDPLGDQERAPREITA